jgi:hypothetical protein
MELGQVLNGWFATYADNRDTVVSIARLSDTTWMVGLEGDQVITATLDEAGDRIGLVAGLGTPKRTGREAVLEGLLTYSALWQETGGVRAALSATGEAVLIVELTLSSLSQHRLHRAIENFTVKAQVLSEFVAGADTPPTDPAAMIRV